MKTHYTIPFFITHEGCPFTCIFCRQDKISGRKKSIPAGDIAPYIRKYLKTIPAKNTHVEVAFFGGSFTGLDESIQRAYLEAVKPFLDKGKICGIRVSTRPDFISQRILDTLKKHGVNRIELGVQSTSDTVLKKAKRGHSYLDIKNASRLILKNNIALGHQIMVGLPGSSFKDEIKTARESIRMGISEVRIYPVIVIKGTVLSEMWKNKAFSPLRENEAIKRSAKLMLLFEKYGVRVIRCGLHPSEGLLSGKDILAGPFHESFRQKVESYIYAQLFRKFFSIKKNIRPVSRIYYNPLDTAYVIGYKRSNAAYIEKILKKHNVLKPSSLIKPKTLKIEFADGEIVKFIRKMSCI